ncbi:MAG: IclR family transcriptional regulator [Alphaproteobacteria bacterium]
MLRRNDDNPLSRYIRILEAVASAPGGMTLSMIAEGTGLQPATSHRLVSSLCDVGFLKRQERTKVYVLGARMLQLSLLAVTPSSVADAARPILRDLVATFGETAYLAELSGTTVGSIAMEMPKSEEKSFVQPGRVMPFHASASAKAICAFQPPGLIDQKLAEPRTRFTADTKMGEGEIRAELEKVRAEAFAVCDNELDPGVLSFAVPVRIDGLGVFLSIGLLGLSDRLKRRPREEIKKKLTEASEMLARKLRTGAGPPSR